MDVDGSYIHRKNGFLREAGEQVLLPADPPPPLTNWKEVTEATYEDFAGCVPQVSSGRHKLRFYAKLCNISKLCSK